MPAPGIPAPRSDAKHAVKRIPRDWVRRSWPLIYLSAFVLAGLIGLAVGHVVEAGRAVELNDLDHRVWRRVVQVRETHPGLTTFFLAVTRAGDPLWASVVVAASVLGLAVLERDRKRPLKHGGPWFFLWVIVGGQLLTRLLKGHFQRPRPGVLFRLVVEDSYSFPSGHSLTTACFCTLWVWVVWNLLPRGRRSLIAVIGPLILLIGALIAASRVWLGVHYLNDVLGGLILGPLWAGLSILAHEWVRRAADNPEKTSRT